MIYRVDVINEPFDVSIESILKFPRIPDILSTWYVKLIDKRSQPQSIHDNFELDFTNNNFNLKKYDKDSYVIYFETVDNDKMIALQSLNMFYEYLKAYLNNYKTIDINFEKYSNENNKEKLLFTEKYSIDCVYTRLVYHNKSIPLYTQYSDDYIELEFSPYMIEKIKT